MQRQIRKLGESNTYHIMIRGNKKKTFFPIMKKNFMIVVVVRASSPQEMLPSF